MNEIPNPSDQAKSEREQKLCETRQSLIKELLNDANSFANESGNNRVRSNPTTALLAASTYARVARTRRLMLPFAERETLLSKIALWIENAQWREPFALELVELCQQQAIQTLDGLRQIPSADTAGIQQRKQELFDRYDKCVCAHAGLRAFGFRNNPRRGETSPFHVASLVPFLTRMTSVSVFASALARSFNVAIVNKARNTKALSAQSINQWKPSQTLKTWQIASRASVLPAWQFAFGLETLEQGAAEMRDQEARLSRIVERIVQSVRELSRPMLAAAASSMILPSPDELKYHSPEAGFATVFVPQGAFSQLTMCFYDDAGETLQTLNGQIVQWLGAPATINDGAATFRLSANSNVDRDRADFLMIGESPWFLE